jgi:hypothetical protein
MVDHAPRVRPAVAKIAHMHHGSGAIPGLIKRDLVMGPQEKLAMAVDVADDVAMHGPAFRPSYSQKPAWTP